MYTHLAVERIARSQVGYHEGRSGGHWNNDQKYSDMLPNFKWSDKMAWCATFAQWCYWMVGVSVPTGAQSASCLTSVRAYKKAGRFTEYPILGGQVFYGKDGGEHTGICYRYDDTYIWVAEGNTNGNGSAEGDGVYEKKRLRRDPYVYGYGIPYLHNYADTPDPKWRGKDLRK